MRRWQYIELDCSGSAMYKLWSLFAVRPAIIRCYVPINSLIVILFSTMLKILITVNFFIEEFLGCFLKTEMMIQYFCGMISEKLKKKNPANIALYNINIPVTLQVNNIDLGLLLVQHVFLFPPPSHLSESQWDLHFE